MEWLKKWLDDSTAIKEIDSSHFLCSHGKLHPDHLSELKRISHSAAQTLYSRYGGGPRIDGTFQSLCCNLLDLLVRSRDRVTITNLGLRRVGSVSRVCSPSVPCPEA